MRNILYIAVFTLLSYFVACETASAQQPATSIQLVFLGTGTPNADPDRFGPSLADMTRHLQQPCASCP